MKFIYSNPITSLRERKHLIDSNFDGIDMNFLPFNNEEKTRSGGIAGTEFSCGARADVGSNLTRSSSTVSVATPLKLYAAVLGGLVYTVYIFSFFTLDYIFQHRQNVPSGLKEIGIFLKVIPWEN